MFDPEKVFAKLSDEEKIQLLGGADMFHTSGLKKHEVGVLRLSDGPNGVRGTKFFNSVPAACFPCGTAMGATMDTELLHRAGELMAEEAKAKGAHVILGPTVNIQRSPLGGRGFESFAEDPLLSGESASAVINGMQKHGVQATIKHFVGNDQEHERRAVNALIPERALREIYLLPFQLAVLKSKPAAFMTAYNQVNGLHVADNSQLLDAVLRKEWNWDGLIMSDWFGTYSTVKGVEAGVDLEMPGPSIWRQKLLKSALDSRDIKISSINERAKAVLKFIHKAYSESGVPEDAFEGTNNTPETAKLLREIAADSIVLLKNDGILPLSKGKKTAVIGPTARQALFCGGGSASLTPYYAVTPLQGFTSKLESKPSYSIGVDTSINLPLVGEYLRTDDDKVGFTWRAYNGPESDPERKLLDTLHLTSSNMFFPEYRLSVTDGDVLYVDIDGNFTPEESGEYEFGLTVRGSGKLYVDGQLVIDNETTQRRGDAFLGTGTVEEVGKVELKAGDKHKIHIKYSSISNLSGAESTVVFGGGIRIGGRKVTDIESELKKAASAAKDADQVIVCLGLGPEYESEGFDRTHMDLPPNVDRLIDVVTKANPNVAVVLQTGTPVALPWLDKVQALVQGWYGGNEIGNAIADIVFGDVNPSGKLPLTYPHRVEDNPAFFNFRSENGTTVYGENVYVGYRYYETVKRDVLFPFGFGLSYTQFKYGKLRVQVVGASPETQTVRATIDVTNSGSVAGKEAVQLYIAQEKPSIRRPVKELKGFNKVSLKPGETKTVEITVPLRYATSYWDESRDSWISEKSTYHVSAGSSSADIRAQSDFYTKSTIWWNGV